MYRLGPEVTVNERLVPFRGELLMLVMMMSGFVFVFFILPFSCHFPPLIVTGSCLFRQYMPSKPARYGIKIWVVCDTCSRYAKKNKNVLLLTT